MTIYSDDKVNKDGSPRKLGGTAEVAKKIGKVGTVDNYENNLRTEGKLELLEQLHGRLDVIEEFMQGKEVVEKKQPKRKLHLVK